MAEEAQYFAVIDNLATREDPAGIVRRRSLDMGGIRDEALGRDRIWRFSPAIVAWKRGELTDELLEVMPDEAQRIIERLTARWAAG